MSSSARIPAGFAWTIVGVVIGGIALAALKQRSQFVRNLIGE